MSHPAVAAVLLAFSIECASSQGAETAPAPRPVGRPGESIGGHTLKFTAPARLKFGQHLNVSLELERDTSDPPYLHLLSRNVQFELTTDRGEVVGLKPELLSSGGSLLGGGADFRLCPTGLHADGVLLRPGKYRLRAVVDARWNPIRPNDLLARMEAEPVTLVVAPRPKPLTPKARERLLADLAAKSPKVRLTAVRRVPPGASEDVIAALVALLADPHREKGLQPPFAPFRKTVVWAAVNALGEQGSPVIAPLLAFARKPENAAHIDEVASLLGRLGYDKRSLTFLVAFADQGTYHERIAATRALGQLGPKAVPELVRIARDREQHDNIRRVAIEESARHGTSETIGMFLREALDWKEPQHRWAAADAIGDVGVRAALPDLKRLAEDEGAEQNARTSALRAYVMLGDRSDVCALLRRVSVTKNIGVRYYAGFWLRGLTRFESP